MRIAGDNSFFIVDLPPVFANDDAVTTMARLDGYIVVVEEGKTTRAKLRTWSPCSARQRLAGVILNKYRGGLVSEGYGVDNYYAAGYGRGQRHGKNKAPATSRRRSTLRRLSSFFGGP